MLRGQHRLGNGLLCLGPADADVACRRGDPVSRAGFAGHCRRDQTPVSRALSKVAPHRFQCVTTGQLLLKAVARSFMRIVIVMFLEILLAELVATVLPVEP